MYTLQPKPLYSIVVKILTVRPTVTVEMVISMMESLTYGNRHQMIRFDVNITESLVDSLINDGFLEEGEFDFDEYINDDWEEWEVSPVAKPVLDAIIDWYEDRVEVEDEKSENRSCRDEWDDLWDKSTDLDKIKLLSETGDNFYDFKLFGDVRLVEVVDVDPNDPYRCYK